jgi:alkylation response protein AidB-like acyl-CoA dehydrogenase
MDFEIRPEERARGRAFAEREIAGSVVARDRASRWDPIAFPRLGDAGLLGAPLPRDAGGEGMSAVGFSGLLRGFAEGSGDAGLALAWAAHVGAALRIAAEGTADQRRRLLPALTRGEAIGAWARREAGRVGDAVGISTRAVARGDRWVLDGVKPWVVNGGVAAWFVVDAVTDPSRGKDGVSTFLVGRDAPGLRVGPRHETPGLRTAVISPVTLDGVEIPRDALLGEEGAAFARAARRGRSWERVAGYAIWLGLMRALVDQTVARSRESVHVGRPLAHSQAARATLADLRIRVELAERLHARAAWRLAGPDPTSVDAERDVAVASLFLARAVPWVIQEAARLQGEAGVERGHLAERSLRDVAVLAHLAEPLESSRSAIAGSLLDLSPL